MSRGTWRRGPTPPGPDLRGRWFARRAGGASAHGARRLAGGTRRDQTTSGQRTPTSDPKSGSLISRRSVHFTTLNQKTHKNNQKNQDREFNSGFLPFPLHLWERSSFWGGANSGTRQTGLVQALGGLLSGLSSDWSHRVRVQASDLKPRPICSLCLQHNRNTHVGAFGGKNTLKGIKRGETTSVKPAATWFYTNICPP